MTAGRRLTLTQQTVPGTGPGTATHAVIIDTPNLAILAVATCPSYTMVNGVATVVAAYDVWEIEDPT